MALHPSNEQLVSLIRDVIGEGAMTQEEIAYAVMQRHPGRWREGTIVSACARANLEEAGEVLNNRRRTVKLWRRRAELSLF